MTIVETTRITSKGQVTIPNRIRKILHLHEGSRMAFCISKAGIVLLPCKVTTELPYSPGEWAKIEKLSLMKGKAYKSAKMAKKHIEAL